MRRDKASGSSGCRHRWPRGCVAPSGRWLKSRAVSRWIAIPYPNDGEARQTSRLSGEETRGVPRPTSAR